MHELQGVYDTDMELHSNESTTASPKLDSDPSLDDRIAFQLHKMYKSFGEQISESFSDFLTKKYQNYVMQLLEENAGVGLPNFPSFSIVERLYHHEHRNFREPCEELVDSCVTYLKNILIKLLNQIFDEEATYRNQMIHKLTDIIFRTLDESVEHCRRDITKNLNIERRVFTLNHYYMDTVNKIKARIQENTDSKKTGMSRIVAVQKNVDVNDFTIDLSEVSNEHQAALDVQIAVKAYCHVVEKRVVDQTVQLCHFWFIDECALKLDSKLSSAFTSAALFEWMREPFEQQQNVKILKEAFNRWKKHLALARMYRIHPSTMLNQIIRTKSIFY